jgi:diadenosine tetraphosphate (Ap4A) HIT family hydrolase
MSLLDSCLFCKIIKGSIPCHKVFETAKALAFLDINPLAEGHVLVIPKTHGERLHMVPEEYLCEMLPVASRIARKLFGEKGIEYNLLQNNGKLAHQEVDHVHFHIIPKRSSDDGLGIRWVSHSVSQDQLAKTAEEFCAALN